MNPKIRIVLKDSRIVNLELYKEFAPITVENFLQLVNKNYYNGTIFHRVIDHFMIQTGGYFLEENQICPLPECKTIKGEFSQNGVNNPLKHELGVISMARTNVMDSATSQFFICSANCPHLDGAYAAFGKVTDEESLKTVLDISSSKTLNIGYGFQDFPYEPIIIEKIELL